MSTIKFGEHLSFSDFKKTKKYLTETECKIVQFFSKPPIKAYINPRKITKEEENYLKDNNIEVIIHGPYTLNLCNGTDSDKIVKSILKDIEIAPLYNCTKIVLHIGSLNKPGFSKENVIKTLKKIIEEKPEGNHTKILLENSAGEGKKVGGPFEDLIYFVKPFSKKDIGLCIDTAHCWGFGAKTLDEYVDKKYIKYIDLIHLNNSIVDIGSKKDRHGHFDFTSDSNKISKSYIIDDIEWCVKNKKDIIIETKKDGKEIRSVREDDLSFIRDVIESL